MMFTDNLHTMMIRAAKAVALEREVAVRDAIIAVLLETLDIDAFSFNQDAISQLADIAQTQGPLTALVAHPTNPSIVFIQRQNNV